MIELFFWASFVVILFVYIGYPLFLSCLPTSNFSPDNTDNRLPTISIIIAAYNESSCIEETIKNKLSLDYPKDLFDIIVVSDGSDDGTDEIVKAYQKAGVRFIRQTPRAGKTSALNIAVALSNSDIVVFSDANSLYEPTALREIIKPFSSPDVGYVTGKMLYKIRGDGSESSGCSAYMRYENWIRYNESRVGSVIGVDGGIDAIRRSLYKPMNPEHLPDFILPLRVIEQGYRVSYAPNAIVSEEALIDSADEFKMRTRVCLRAFNTLFEMRDLMSIRNGFLAFQLISHKLLRYFVFVFCVVAFASNAFLLDSGFYQFTFACQVIGYVFAFCYWRYSNNLTGLISFPLYFVLLNVASGIAFFKFMKGEKQVLWTPRKGA